MSFLDHLGQTSSTSDVCVRDASVGSGGETPTDERIRQFVRYCFVGLLSVGLNTVTIIGLTRYFGLNYLWSVAICFVFVTTVGYILNRGWTFVRSNRGHAIASLRYVLATVGQLGLSLVCCSITVSVFHLRYEVVALVLSAIFAPFSYLVHRGWSFGLKWRKV